MGDLSFKVRQVTEYPMKAAASASDAILVQQDGLGGPYAWTPATGVLGALGGIAGGTMWVGFPPPANTQGEGILSNFLGVLTDEIGFNCYPTLSGGALALYNSGFAGTLSQTASTGTFEFNVNGPGTAGEQIAAWTSVAQIDVNGHMWINDTLELGHDPRNPTDATTMQWVNAAIHAQAQAIADSTVWSLNGRRGTVFLDWRDLASMGGAPLVSPCFVGWPTCPTADTLTGSLQLANTMFVQQAIDYALNMFIASYPLVWTFNGRSGEITLTPDDLTAAGGVPSDSPVFTGVPTVPTAPANDNSQQIANTQWVQQTLAANPQGWAPLASPVFTGIPQGPTAAVGTSTGQLATTAFVHNAIVASTTGVASFNTRTGAVTLQMADITAAGGAPLASPNFTGMPAAGTPPPGDAGPRLATTEFVTIAIQNALPTSLVATFNGRSGAVTLSQSDIMNAGGAPNTSPFFTGTPQAPNPPPGTNTQQIATCAFVLGELGAAAVSSFNGRTGAVTLNSADISAAGGAVLASPAFTGTPTAPTAASGSNNTTLATTAFVANAISLMPSGVTTFNGRTGAITLNPSDISAASGALLASPAFTGTPSAPTAATGTNSTQLATCAFVQASLAAGLVSPNFTGVPTAPTAAVGTNSAQIATTAFVASAVLGSVATFNGRSGNVTLTSADVSGAGGALLASPGFTGTPTAPTATTGDASTQLATTAFVQAAVAASTSGVASFNGRTGAVTLSGTDISNAGGALLASPAFSGIPTVPTATPGTNSTQAASTAFVANALSVPSGTVMVFYQGAAPVGWTKVTTQNDKALRVVNTATGGTAGGTNAFSSVMAQTAVGNHTLAAGEIPQLTSTGTYNNQINFGAGSSYNYVPHASGAWAGLTLTQGSGFVGIYYGGNLSYYSYTTAAIYAAVQTTNTGGGAHNHPITMDMQYCDVILASKN